MKQHHYIYKTVHIPSGRYYVGRHSSDKLDDDYLGSGKRLKPLLKAHFRHEFKRCIIAFANDPASLKALEALIVDDEMLADPLNLNVAYGGGGCGVISESAKLLISKKLTGYKHTDQSKKNMSNAHKGYVWSASSRAKQSLALTGRDISLETRIKLSKASTGRVKSEAERTKISEATKAGMLRRKLQKEL